MAAPQIPNLLETLRASKGSARTGRNNRLHDEPTASSSAQTRQDWVVQQTDDDAAGSRLSAVEAGYLVDPFARLFASSNEVVRRMPIINRGTYVRTTAIDRLIYEFLERYRHQTAQIISLGAGTDTRFFRLMEADRVLAHRLQYHEIDFPLTTAKKIKTIESTPSLLSLLDSAQPDSSSPANALLRNVGDQTIEISADKTSLSSANYYIHALDLRDFASPTPPQIRNILSTTPTLILSECCLTYLSPHTSSSILRHFTSKLIPSPTPLQIIQYEPLHPHDAFGKTMISNLSSRHISMPGLGAYATLDAHKQRLRDVGVRDSQEGWEVKEIWDSWIGSEEKESLRGLEMVDEEEEWILLAGHYGIIRGTRTGIGTHEMEKESI